MCISIELISGMICLYVDFKSNPMLSINENCTRKLRKTLNVLSHKSIIMNLLNENNSCKLTKI